MSSGIELIRQEREEQKAKHSRTVEYDRRNNSNGELLEAALFCIFHLSYKIPNFFIDFNSRWPESWSLEYREKILRKSDLEKLAVAGALYMAEGERLNTNIYDWRVVRIAVKMDKIIDFEKIVSYGNLFK